MKRVSFSDELAAATDGGDEGTHAERMAEIGNSCTWQHMKQNYTTWGQIKCDKSAGADPKKCNSMGDMRALVSSSLSAMLVGLWLGMQILSISRPISTN